MDGREGHYISLEGSKKGGGGAGIEKKEQREGERGDVADEKI